MQGGKRWLVRLAPWAVAGLILAILLGRYSPADIAAELARGAVLAIVPWSAAIAIAALVAMAAADWLVFSPALGDRGRRLRLIDVVRGRAAASALQSIHYGLSSGGYAVWLARRTGAGRGAAAGAATYQVANDLGAIFLFALPAALLGGRFLPARVGESAALVAAAGLAGVALLLVALPRACPRRWRGAPVLAAWRRVPVAAGAASALLRAVGLAVNVAGTWAAARAFGLTIPAPALAAGLPIVYLIGAMPVNVLGLGAVQAAWLALFERHAPGAQILAFQFAFQLLCALVLVARGLPFLPGVLRDVGRGAPPA